jgi:O-antigen/teichoic acid export membrane protein
MYQTFSKAIQEKWQHAGFQKYLKNTSWLFLGKIVSLAVSFITSIYVIRHLGPSNYGLLTFSVSFVALFSFIATLGIDSVLYRELAKDLSKKNELIGTALFLKITASILAMLCIFAGMYTLQTDALTKFLIFINSFSLFFSSFVVIGYYFQAKVQAQYQAIPLIVVTVILNILKVLVIFYNKGIIYFALVLALEYILYALFNFYYYTRSGNSIFDFTVKKDVAIALLRDSWPLMLSTAFIIIYTRIDQVMLKFITNDFNVGVYDAAAKISEVWYFIPALIIGSIFPAIINSKKVSEEFFKARMIKLYSLLFYMSLLAAFPITLFSHFIINTIYGAAFISAAGVLSIYVWAGIPVFLTMALNTYLLAENKNIVSFTGSIIGMVVNVALNLWLIPLYGIYGAATATLISYSCVPLSALLFKGSRNQLLLMKDGALYPFRWLFGTIWTTR